MDGNVGNGKLHPDLAGGIDLGGPVQQAVREFGSLMIQRQGIAAVMVGLTADGHVVVKAHVTGTIFEAKGLLDEAQLVISAMGQQQQQQQRKRG